MKTEVLQNDRFDSLVAGLLKATALRDDEIENIASSEGLFLSVRTRIIADNISRVESTGTITFFQRSAILTAAAAVIVAAVFGTMMVARRPLPTSIAKSTVPAPDVQDPIVHFKEMDETSEPTPDYGSDVKQPVQHVVEKAMDYRPMVQERRVLVRSQPQVEEQPRFYALAGLRQSDVAADGSRIIRVELPRASLVALGVNIPLDSDRQLIKTDLLVGPDGVPRAIRLVE
jgi:hypothetical protein